MKNRILLIMAGLALVLFTGNQACAFDLEDDMAEGITFSAVEDNTDYKYDSANAAAKESMTEFNFFPEEKKKEHAHFAGDPSCPSMHHLMAEGICMDSLRKGVAAN